MKSFILLACVATMVAAYPESMQMKKEMVIASDSGSSGKTYAEFANFDKNFGILKEEMKMGSFPKLPTMPKTTATPAAASAAVASVTEAGTTEAASAPEGSQAGRTISKTAGSDDDDGCKKNCIDEGELGPIDAPSVIKILGNKDGVYNVFSTYKNYGRVAELLRGKTLESKDEANKLCLHGGAEGTTHKIMGFDPAKTFAMDCKMSKMGLSATCTVNEAASDNKDLKAYPTQMSAVWTDGKSYVIGVCCWNDGQKSWSVLSNDKAPIPEDTKKMVLDKVNELGLDVSDPVALAFDSCKL